MPPRITSVGCPQSFNLLSLLQNLPTAPGYGKNGVCASCSYTFSAKGPMTQRKQNKSRLKPHRNPYRDAQAKQRKAANIARQKGLREERTKALGDPIRSLPTPFIKSLATGEMPEAPTKEQLRNFFLGPEELSRSLEYSKKLAAPYEAETIEDAEGKVGVTAGFTALSQARDSAGGSLSNYITSKGPATLPIERGDVRLPSPAAFRASSLSSYKTDAEEIAKSHERRHDKVSRALSVITSLDNGSSSDLTRFNIQRCISTFGRQNTDSMLPPRPKSIYDTNPTVPKLRAGPDTGSSEVQAAILTAKINTLANNLHNKDKHSKRSLRLMVHKRQKLLAYLRRRERAGPRWKHLVENLGIQDAMWKGEITL